MLIMGFFNTLLQISVFKLNLIKTVNVHSNMVLLCHVLCVNPFYYILIPPIKTHLYLLLGLLFLWTFHYLILHSMPHTLSIFFWVDVVFKVQMDPTHETWGRHMNNLYVISPVLAAILTHFSSVSHLFLYSSSLPLFFNQSWKDRSPLFFSNN